MIAFLFPGQGSQYVGMGKDIYQAFSEAKEVIDAIDDALNESLSTLMFDGPASDISLTRNTQPALMAVSLAVFHVLQAASSKNLLSSYFAGHSLGEYSAHSAIQTFSLEDTARLLRMRGDAMQHAVPIGLGGMAALIGSGGIEQAEALCQAVSEKESLCEVANDNSAEQIVISGHGTAVHKAVERASEFGFRKAIPLEVSAPFHCSLMQPAANKMADALSQINTQDQLKAKLIANVTSDIVTSGPEAKELLIQQVTGRVRWRETIQKLHTFGVQTFIEIGSGKVLTGLTKRSLKDVTTYSVETPEEIELVLKEVL